MRELSDKEEAPRARWPNYWLLGEYETSSMDVLAVYLNGGETPRGVRRGASYPAKRHPVLKKAV
jgi:hypothetical protein